MRIGRPRITVEGGAARLAATVAVSGRSRELWYSVGDSFAHALSADRLDAFVVALLPQAMKLGEDLQCDGPLSERLFYNLSRHCVPLLKLAVPGLRPVRILPGGLTAGGAGGGRGVATAFSGGVDSFCALADHFFGEVPAGHRVTHLIHNNVAASDAAGRELSGRRYARLTPFAEETGLPFLKIDSNLGEILEVSFSKTHTLRNISAALALQGLLGRFLYASGVAYADCFADAPPDIAYVDPMLVPLLSTETLECIPAGSQHSRVEKTERISDLEPSRRYLQVCASPSQGAEFNCSVCWKCLRVQFTLELLGKLDLYERVFDLARYRARRTAYLGDVLASTNHFQREVVRLARERGFRFPAAARLSALAQRLAPRGLVPGFARRAVRRLLAAPRLDGEKREEDGLR